MKKIICILLVLILAISLIPLAASARGSEGMGLGSIVKPGITVTNTTHYPGPLKLIFGGTEYTLGWEESITIPGNVQDGHWYNSNDGSDYHGFTWRSHSMNGCTCSGCGAVLHNWDSGTASGGNCADAATVTYTCTNGCGETKTEAGEKNPAVHKQIIAVDAVPGNCMDQGTEAHYKCTGCNALFSDAEGKNPIEAPVQNGTVASRHKYADNSSRLVHHEPVAGTCAAAGTAEYWECSGCGKLFSDDSAVHVLNAIPTTEKDPDNHTKLVFRSDMTPTCATVGCYAHYQCEGCGATFFDAQGKEEAAPTEITRDIDPSNHEGFEYQQEVAATCVATGTKAHWKCTGCSILAWENLGEQRITDAKVLEIVVNEDNHVNIEEVPEQDATCVATGVAAHYKCSDCGDLFEDEDGKKPTTLADLELEIDGTNHAADELTHHAAVPGNCTREGTAAYYECPECKKLYSDAAGKTAIDKPASTGTVADAHDWNSGTITKQPTCAAGGERTYTCQNNSAHTYKENLDPDPNTHVYGDYQFDTSQHWQVCSNSACKHETTHVNHTMGNWGASNARALNQESRKCTVCNYTETRTVHVHEFSKYKFDANKHWQTCSARDTCTHPNGTIFNLQEHDYGLFTVVKKATLTEYGLRQRTCKTCGYIQQQRISMLDDNPRTGDYIMISVGVMAVAGIALAVLLIAKKKKKKT